MSRILSLPLRSRSQEDIHCHPHSRTLKVGVMIIQIQARSSLDPYACALNFYGKFSYLSE